MVVLVRRMLRVCSAFLNVAMARNVCEGDAFSIRGGVIALQGVATDESSERLCCVSASGVLGIPFNWEAVG